MLSRYTLRLAVKINDSLKADFQSWVESCEQDRAEGHTAHYCEHGKTRWVDYDNICGPCEDGRTMGDPRQRMECAIDSAKGRVERVKKITEHMGALRELGVNFTSEQMKPVWDEMNRMLTVE